MNKYDHKFTETESESLVVVCGSVPYDDNTSSLAKIYNYIVDNNIVSRHEMYNVRNTVEFEELTGCKI
jgi:hypothetical protein